MTNNRHYRGTLDIPSRRGKFTPVLLEDKPFPVSGEANIKVNGVTYQTTATYNGLHLPGESHSIHRLISHEDGALIAVRLVHTPQDTQHLLINEITPETEVNFGYLIFRAISEHVQIRDYCPEDPLTALDEDYRDYGNDPDLTSLVLDTFADIAVKVYGKKRIRNTYPYDAERERFLSNGFVEVEEPAGKVWIREL